MADFTATFEAGVNGNAVTTAGGEASATAWVQTSGTITYDTAHVAHGTLAAKFVGAGEWMRWDPSPPADSYGRIYLYATANPTGTTDLIAFHNGGSALASIYITTAGKVQSSYPGQGVITSAVSIALNQWVRIEYRYLANAGAGLLDAKLFNTADSSTADETIANGGLTSAAFNRMYMGDGAIANSWGSNFWLDDIVANATSYPGPVVAAAAGVGPYGTVVLDDFNRADAGTLGANWGEFRDFGIPTPAIVSNECARAASFEEGYYNVAEYGPDCEVFCTIVDMPDNQTGRLYVRLANLGAAVTGYYLEYDAGPTVYLARMDDQDDITYLPFNYIGPGVGDKLALVARGSTFMAMKDVGAGWVPCDDGAGGLAVWTDETYSNAGYLGLVNQNNTAWAIDDFGGGTISRGRRIYKRLVGPEHLGTSAADLYTVPTGVRTTIRRIFASNPSGSPVDFTLSIDTGEEAVDGVTADFEAGVDGATITTDGGEASATAWNEVQGTPTYSATHSAHGSLAGKYTASGDLTRFDLTATTDHYGRLYFWAAAAPTAFCRILASYSNTFLGVFTDGKLYFQDTGGSGVASAALTFGQWYRIEYHVVVSATVGQLELKYFLGDSTSPVEILSSAADRNTGASQTQLYFGQNIAGYGAAIWLDDIVANATSYPGPAVVAALPLYDSENIPAGGAINASPTHALVAGEVIQGFAGSATTVVLTVDGIEEAI